GDPPGPGAQPVLRPGRMRIVEQPLGSADLAAFNAAAVPQRLNPQRQRLVRVESEGLLEAVVALEAEQGGPGSVTRQELRHGVAAHHFILALRVDVAAAVPAVITLAQVGACVLHGCKVQAEGVQRFAAGPALQPAAQPACALIPGRVVRLHLKDQTVLPLPAYDEALFQAADLCPGDLEQPAVDQRRTAPQSDRPIAQLQVLFRINHGSHPSCTSWRVCADRTAARARSSDRAPSRSGVRAGRPLRIASIRSSICALSTSRSLSTRCGSGLLPGEGAVW